MQIEILNPKGQVSYRRPDGHRDIAEALKTPGYSVRLSLPEGSVNGPSAMWFILGIQQTFKHWIVFDVLTNNGVVWAIDYQPSEDKRLRAVAWAKDPQNRIRDADTVPVDSFFNDISRVFSQATAPSTPGSSEEVTGAIRRACENDALMDECLALLKVGYEKGDDLRKVMRHVCGNFALRAFGVEVPGQPPLADDAPLPVTVEPPAFPSAGLFAWHYPGLTLVRIVQQHDAFEWEVRTYPLEPGHKESRCLIASKVNLVPLSEAESDAVTRGENLHQPHCRSDGDGHCTWKCCPQIMEGEPEKTGRACPFQVAEEEI